MRMRPIWAFLGFAWTRSRHGSILHDRVQAESDHDGRRDRCFRGGPGGRDEVRFLASCMSWIAWAFSRTSALWDLRRGPVRQSCRFLNIPGLAIRWKEAVAHDGVWLRGVAALLQRWSDAWSRLGPEASPGYQPGNPKSIDGSPKTYFTW